MAKSQIDDNKKLYESLKSIIDRTEAKINPEEIQDQVHLLEANKV